MIVKARIILVLVSLASGFWYFDLYVGWIRISNDAVFAVGHCAASLLFGNYPAGFMATWVQYIGKVLPLTYSRDALTQIIIYGKNLTNLGGDILALLIFLVILLFLNILGLKRYRKV